MFFDGLIGVAIGEALEPLSGEINLPDHVREAWDDMLAGGRQSSAVAVYLWLGIDWQYLAASAATVGLAGFVSLGCSGRSTWAEGATRVPSPSSSSPPSSASSRRSTWSTSS